MALCAGGGRVTAISAAAFPPLGSGPCPCVRSVTGAMQRRPLAKDGILDQPSALEPCIACVCA